MTEEKDLKVLDIIIEFVKAIKNTPKINKDEAYFYMNDGKNILWNAKYLLGQVLRQYAIKPNHKFISVRASKLWKEITDEEIDNYYYTKGVPVHRETILNLYKGAEKEPSQKDIKFEVGQKFAYRQVFHDEHIIPIDMVIEKLCELESVNYENVQKILDNIYMCRMLKSENIKLNKGNKSKRNWNVIDTIEDIYIEKNDIQILDWERIKMQIQ